jgi:phosphoribosylanthranilate isomerase
MWIKICGNTNLEDVQFAVKAGADALGFLFAPSPRRVEPKLVQKFTERLPRAVETYGVFVDAGFDEIVATVAAAGLTGVQLHRSADALLPSRLRAHFAQQAGRFGIVGVLHYKEPVAEFEQKLTDLTRNDSLDAILVDSSSARALGGTGTSFPWEKARSSFLRVAPHLRMIAAGGLSPENVKQAIRILQPWGVDVVSGVESAPGKKDLNRVQAFIASAREAAIEIGETPIPVS